MAGVVIVSSLGKSLVSFRGPLIRHLVARGHRVTAMAPEAEAPAGLDALGARYRSLPLERAGTDPLRDARAIWKLARVFRELRPDVVLSYNVKPVVYGTLAAALARVPRRYALVTGLGYLFLPDGTLKQRLVQGVARPLYRSALTAATAVFVQNPDDANDLRAVHVLPRRKRVVQVAGSGIDLNEFPAHPVPDGPPVFLFVGRLLKDKGVFELVDAARRLRRVHPEARVRLIGGLDPNPSSASAADVAAWQAEGVVEYLGETRDVRPFLRDCTVFVLPSYREGTPRSVLEAMATGRAVVTTDAPGCRETVVHGDNGLLVTVRDAASLADAMQRLASDPAEVRRMGARSRGIAEQRFDVERVVAAMLETMQLDGSAEKEAG